MKKFVSVLLAVVMVMTLAVTAFAAKRYTVDELGISLSIPDSYYVITRNSTADDPAFTELGLNYDSIMDAMISGGVYLDAVKADGEQIMLLKKAVPGFGNLSDYSVEDLEAMETDFIASYEESGSDVLDYQVYESDKYNYLRVEAYDESIDMYVLQYCNVIDGQMYSINLAAESEINSTQISTMEGVVDTVTYEFLGESAEEPTEAYTEEVTEEITYSFDFGGVEEDTEDEYADDEYAKDEYTEDEDTDDEEVYADGYISEPSSNSSFSIPGYVFIILIVILLIVIAAIVIVVISGKKKQAASADVPLTVQGNYPPVQPPIQNVYQPAPVQPQFIQPTAPVQNIQPEEIRPAQPLGQSKLPEEAPTIVAAPVQPAAEEAPKASFCGNCGAPVAEGGAFCPMCGARIG